MKTVYIASKFKFVERVKKLNNLLNINGHIATVIWWAWEGKTNLKNLPDDEFYNDNRIKYVKKRDLFGIDAADVFVLLSDLETETSFNGANFEMGYATAKGKPIFIIGKMDKSALYAGVTFCINEMDFIDKIKEV